MHGSTVNQAIIVLFKPLFSRRLRYAAELEFVSKNIVLVVEDEPLVVRMVTVALSTAGFRAAVAENGAVGLDVYRDLRDQICLVLADVLMPVLDGVAMSDRLREFDPGLPILLMTGYSQHDLVREAQARFPLIRKPFLPADLIRRVRALLADELSAVG